MPAWIVASGFLGPKSGFLILSRKLLEGVLQAVKRGGEREVREGGQGEGSAFEGGASPKPRVLSAAETEDDAGLESEAILMGAAEPRVKVVSLDEPDGHAWLPLVVGSPAKGHGKGAI